MSCVVDDPSSLSELIHQLCLCISPLLTSDDVYDLHLRWNQRLDLIGRGIEIGVVTDVADQYRRVCFAGLFINNDLVDYSSGFRCCSYWQSTHRHLRYS